MAGERKQVDSKVATAPAFPMVKKGFDPDAVRAHIEALEVALGEADAARDELLARVATAELRADHPVLDEATLVSNLGQQSAAVLRSAHEEAARLTAAAEEEAHALMKDAQRQFAEATVAAEAHAAERIAAAELTIASMNTRVADDAQRALEAAKSDGADLIERARLHGIAIVERAQESRRQVLADLAARRREMAEQILALRDARDQIARSIITARQSFDRIVEDLGRSDAAAQHLESVGELDEAVRPALDTESVATQEEISVAAFTADTQRSNPPSTPIRRIEPIEPTPTDASRARSIYDYRDDEPETPKRPLGGDHEPATVVLDEAVKRPRDLEDLESKTRVKDETTPARVDAAPQRVDEDGADVIDDAPAPRPRSAPSADDLFGRLRRGVGADVTRPAVQVVPATVQTVVTPTAPRPASSGPAVAASVLDRPASSVRRAGATGGGFARRSELLDELSETLVRRVKRALGDDQNNLLDLLRQRPREWSEELGRAEGDQRARFAGAVTDAIDDAFAAGVAFAAEQGASGGAGAPSASLVVSVIDELAAQVVTTLRRRLAGSDAADAAERINAAYREWRGEKVLVLCQDRVVEAFHIGVRAGASGTPGFRWLPDPSASGCADCEDNVLADVLAPNEPFPTGQFQPPAHPGCRCLLLPVN